MCCASVSPFSFFFRGWIGGRCCAVTDDDGGDDAGGGGRAGGGSRSGKGGHSGRRANDVGSQSSGLVLLTYHKRAM